MGKSLSFRPRSRILPVLLTAWMVVFGVAEAIHTHGLPGARAGQPTVDLQAVCLACLAAHNPAPAAVAPIVFDSPQGVLETRPVEIARSFRTLALPILPSRAPPVPSTTQA